MYDELEDLSRLLHLRTQDPVPASFERFTYAATVSPMSESCISITSFPPALLTSVTFTLRARELTALSE